MKKVTILLGLLLTCTIASAAIVSVGSYHSSYLEKDYPVHVELRDDGSIYAIVVGMQGEYDSDKAAFDIKENELDSWVTTLTQIKEKYSEWKKIAADNKVTDMSKDFPVKLPRVNVSWYGSEWWFAYNQLFTPFFRITEDGVAICAWYKKCYSSSNEYIDKKILMGFSEESDIESLISLLSPEKIYSVLNTNNSKEDLFK